MNRLFRVETNVLTRKSPLGLDPPCDVPQPRATKHRKGRQTSQSVVNRRGGCVYSVALRSAVLCDIAASRPNCTNENLSTAKEKKNRTCSVFRVFVSLPLQFFFFFDIWLVCVAVDSAVVLFFNLLLKGIPQGTFVRWMRVGIVLGTAYIG